jgi:glycosyltransferase involved in cell wall biosynthesis
MSEHAAPLVSVVMPIYNVSAYLAEAIESVRAQTYPNWELLLCDDGSTDGSSEIAARYAALDPEQIRHLAHEGRANLGASAARNLGLRHARGEIIAMLDGDDVWLPEKLEAQIAILESRPDADALYGATLYWHSWTGAREDAARDYFPQAGIPSGTLLAPRELITKLLRREIMSPCTCSMVVRAEAVRRAGGFVDEFRYIYTDQAFYARLSLVASVLYVDRCWDRYRLHPASSYSTVQRTGEGREARLRFLSWLESYLARDAASYDPALRIALRGALRRERHPRLFRVIDGVRSMIRRAFVHPAASASSAS